MRQQKVEPEGQFQSQKWDVSSTVLPATNFYLMNPNYSIQASSPRGYFQIRRSGGGRLGLHIKFGGKIWGRVRPSSPNKRKNLGSSVITRRKGWEKVPILRSYLKFRGQNLGYLSFIFLEAKYWAPTRISEANFGAKPPDLLIWKHPPGRPVLKKLPSIYVGKYGKSWKLTFFRSNPS